MGRSWGRREWRFVIGRRPDGSAAKKLLGHHRRPLSIEWLPAYAAELHPDEQVWKRTKFSGLTNFVPDEPLHLGQSVAASLRRTRSHQPVLRSLFKHAQYLCRWLIQPLKRH